MNSETQWVQIIALLGWLILVGGALASYKLSWGKAAKLALTWLAIFVGVFVLFVLVRGG